MSLLVVRWEINLKKFKCLYLCIATRKGIPLINWEIK